MAPAENFYLELFAPAEGGGKKAGVRGPQQARKNFSFSPLKF